MTFKSIEGGLDDSICAQYPNASKNHDSQYFRRRVSCQERGNKKIQKARDNSSRDRKTHRLLTSRDCIRVFRYLD